jgi:beta-glucanase (GH16 family)
MAGQARRPVAVFLAAFLALMALESQAAWTLAREFDFSRGDALDPAQWSVETGFQRNREAQYYTRGNVMLKGGALVLEARQEETPNTAHRPGSRDWRQQPPRAAYTSGSIVLREPLQYARVEVVARSPSGKGVWPAVWLLREGAGEYGEIDLYEAVGKHPDTVFGAVHFGRTAGSRQHRGGSVVLPGFEGSWRTHTLEWTPDRIAMKVDAQPVFSFDPREATAPGIDPLRRPMFLHVNLALGGTWAGAIDDSVLPARFEIARIRIYRWTADGPADRAAAPAEPFTPVPAPAGDPGVRWGR